VLALKNYMEDQNNVNNTGRSSNAAKFAFFYLLSLIALVFMAVSTGMIVFQIINKYIPDLINQYSGRYSDEIMKFAISALIISTPIFYVISRIIHKSLFRGELGRDSGVRRWLTYFILLVASGVMIGWAIAIINNFLDGELTTKFILKALTALIIAAGIFSFYLYDIRRAEVAGKKSVIIKTYFIISLIVVLAAFVASLFVVESPTKTRDRKMDQKIINTFSTMDRCVDQHWQENDNLPENLDQILNNCSYAFPEKVREQIESNKIEYKKGEDNNYELCAHFRTSNKSEKDGMFIEPELKSYLHDAGWQCLSREARGVEYGKVELRTPTMVD